MDNQKEQINFIKDKLKGKSLYIGMPIYGGNSHVDIQTNVMAVINLGLRLGVSVLYQPLTGESLIQRGRNALVQLFYESDCTHMLFWDADVVFSNPIDVFVLLAFCGEKHPDSKDTMDIVCAAYPKKLIAWDKILLAAKSGLCDDDPSKLSDYGCDFVVNLYSGETKFSYDKPVRIKEGGTGSMMFSKGVIEKHRKKYPNKKYIPDHKRHKDFNGSKPSYALFDCCIEDSTKRYLSEDYYFSKESDKIGLKIFLLPWIKASHVGSYKYVGDFGSIVKLINAVKDDYHVAISGPVIKKEDKNASD